MLWSWTFKAFKTTGHQGYLITRPARQQCVKLLCSESLKGHSHIIISLPMVLVSIMEGTFCIMKNYCTLSAGYTSLMTMKRMQPMFCNCSRLNENLLCILQKCEKHTVIPNTIKNMLSSVLRLPFVEVGTCTYMHMCQHTCKHTKHTHAQTQRTNKCKIVNYSYSIHMNGSLCTRTHTLYICMHMFLHTHTHTHMHAHVCTHTHTQTPYMPEKGWYKRTTEGCTFWLWIARALQTIPSGQ